MSHIESFVHRARSQYGRLAARCETAGLALLLACAAVSPAAAAATTIAAFGDSLSAGYNLPAADAFPAVLERALRKDGYDVAVSNAAVSGDTTQGGLERLDWSVPDGTDLAVVELGANDMLRGVDPAITAKNLADIVADLKRRNVRVLLAGMYAARELEGGYRERFDAIYPSLAHRDGVPLYPFFLAGLIGHPELHLPDGLHPNAAGVEVIVRGILPDVEAALDKMGAKPAGPKG